MSVSRAIHAAFVALCSIGLGLPASAFGGCCCVNAAEQSAQTSASHKSCCAGKHQRQPKSDLVCPPTLDCSARQTCPLCQSAEPVLVNDKSPRPLVPAAHAVIASARAVPVSEPSAVPAAIADPSFSSHNHRLAQLSVWRK